MKKISEDEAEKRVAYEVSVSKLELLEAEYEDGQIQEERHMQEEESLIHHS